MLSDGNPGSWELSFGRYPDKAAGQPPLDNIRPYGWVQAIRPRGDVPSLRSQRRRTPRVWLGQGRDGLTVGVYRNLTLSTFRRGRGIHPWAGRGDSRVRR